MTPRSSLLALTLILVSAAVAAAGATPPVNVETAAAELFTSSAEADACVAEISLPEVGRVEPIPAGAPCGACSDTGCQGVTTGHYCGVSSRGRCQIIGA